MTSAKRSAKAEFWQALLAEKDQCSLPVAEFCKLKEISLQSFYQWRRRLRKPEPLTTSLLPVHVVPPANASPLSAIQVITASGVFLRFDTNTPHSQIAGIIEAIDSSSRGEA